MTTYRNSNRHLNRQKIKNMGGYEPDLSIEYKICNLCMKEKLISFFHKDRRHSSGYQLSCNKCRSTANRDNYSNRSIKRKQQQKNVQLKRLYGITLEDFNLMLKNQNYSCKICKIINPPLLKRNKSAWSVDHNHTTGKVRGLLCNLCNQALGSFKDNISILENAILYLKETNEAERYS